MIRQKTVDFLLKIPIFSLKNLVLRSKWGKCFVIRSRNCQKFGFKVKIMVTIRQNFGFEVKILFFLSKKLVIRSKCVKFFVVRSRICQNNGYKVTIGQHFGFLQSKFVKNFVKMIVIMSKLVKMLIIRSQFLFF